MTSGPALRRAGDLAGVLFTSSSKNGAPVVIFIDEIHRLPVIVAEALCKALEDGTLSVVVGSGDDERSVSLTLPPIVCAGATTKPDALSQPLRDRFEFQVATL